MAESLDSPLRVNITLKRKVNRRVNVPRFLSGTIAPKESIEAETLAALRVCHAKSLGDDVSVGEVSELEFSWDATHMLLLSSSCCFLYQAGRPWKRPRAFCEGSSRGISCLNLQPVWVNAHRPSWIHMSQYTLLLFDVEGLVARMRSIWFWGKM